MSNTSRTYPVIAMTTDGISVPMTLTATEVRAALLGGPRLTDGQHAPAGWSELLCTDCDSVAHWCPELTKVIGRAEADKRRDAAERA